MAGDGAGLAVGAVLAATRAQEQQRSEGAGGADQVDGRRSGEVLHADVDLQPAAAEHPARRDRVDERAEDHGVDDVHAELDALERGAPHDGQRDGAEDELEEPLRLDGGVGEAHDREGLLRITEVAQEEPGVADDMTGRAAEGEGEAHRPVTDRRNGEVGEDLRYDRSRVLAAREADLQEGEARLHEHHEAGGDDHPERVDAHRVGQPLAGCIERVGHGRGWQHQQGQKAQKNGTGHWGTAHGSSWVECASQSVGRRAERLSPGVERSTRRIRHPVEPPRPRGRTMPADSSTAG